MMKIISWAIVLTGLAGCAAVAPSGGQSVAGASAVPEHECRAVRLADYGYRAVCLSDAELDTIVAGRVIIVETGFNTWIVNPGRASVGILHKDGSFTCINLCGVPPPPGGGGGN
jgi:hypothetical protein